MNLLDWLVLLGAIVGIAAYGTWRTRHTDSLNTYLKGNHNTGWVTIGLSVMATQASTITYLSLPGQAYENGIAFIQNYFGLPLALIIVCAFFLPIYRKLGVYTAYEYLETRFDRKTRMFTSLLFLLSRGLSTGISIYAPAIILSSILGWNIYLTNVLMGGLLIIYTYTGGAKAVAHTQKLQFLIILASMGVAGYLVVHRLPQGIGFKDALYIAGKSGKLNVITTGFNWKDKYNIWSGIFGGFFLALSYFGTDQSQVGRYITGKDARESKLGLLLNGLVKIPMQFAILLIGALVFAFYSFQPAPLYFNSAAYNNLKTHEPQTTALAEARYNDLHERSEKQAFVIAHLNKENNTPLLDSSLREFTQTRQQIQSLRDSISDHISSQHYSPEKNDTNYIFLYFVKNALPKGIVGLLFAVIILASWGSISAALNSLTASSLMDVQMMGRAQLEPEDELRYGRLHTLAWGVFCIGVAMFAAKLGSLIEAVNILGSLFYGTILGIFLVAFYVKRAKGNVVFAAAIIAEVSVIVIYCLDIVSFLWLNVIGALMVVVLSMICYFRKEVQ